MNESEVKMNGRCDFCQIWEAEFTINGGLWWICKHCMEKEMAQFVHPPMSDDELKEEEE